MSARLKATSLASLLTALGCTYAFAFSPEVEREVHAQLAIKSFLAETKPSWTCEYLLNYLRDEDSFRVYRVTFPGDEKCSRSRQTEYFEAFYDPKRDKVVKMFRVQPDPPPIDAKRSNQSLEPTAGRREV